MGRQFLAWLPQVTIDNEQKGMPWCATNDMTVRLKVEGEAWEFEAVKKFPASENPLQNEATATGWYWPHYYYDVLSNSYVEDRDNVKTSIDSAIGYAVKVMAKLTGSETKAVVMNGGDQAVMQAKLQSILDKIDDRVSLVDLESLPAPTLKNAVLICFHSPQSQLSSLSMMDTSLPVSGPSFIGRRIR